MYPEQMMGIGSYVGEVRQGPDGNLYQWVEGIDGFGNPIGFWRFFKKIGRGIRRGVSGLYRLAKDPRVRACVKACYEAYKSAPKPESPAPTGGGTQGIGSYVGEIRQGPDGQLYQWVEGIDGFGNPIGFWKAFRAVGRLVRKGVGGAIKLARSPGVREFVRSGYQALTNQSEPEGMPGPEFPPGTEAGPAETSYIPQPQFRSFPRFPIPRGGVRGRSPGRYRRAPASPPEPGPEAMPGPEEEAMPGQEAMPAQEEMTQQEPSEAEMVEGLMGIGNFIGEIRQGPDGNLYQWVEGVDGFGNPIGFWKAFKKIGRFVGRAVKKIAPIAAGFIPGVGPLISAGIKAASRFKGVASAIRAAQRVRSAIVPPESESPEAQEPMDEQEPMYDQSYPYDDQNQMGYYTGTRSACRAGICGLGHPMY